MCAAAGARLDWLARGESLSLNKRMCAFHRARDLAAHYLERTNGSGAGDLSLVAACLAAETGGRKTSDAERAGQSHWLIKVARATLSRLATLYSAFPLFLSLTQCSFALFAPPLLWPQVSFACHMGQQHSAAQKTRLICLVAFFSSSPSLSVQ